MKRSDANRLVARADGLSVSFSGRQALQEVCLEVLRNELTVVIGRSGSGKSTLLRSFNRLNECYAGSVTTGSVELQLGDTWLDVYQNNFPVTQLRRRVGMVFQNPNLLPMSIEKNISLPLKLVLGLGKSLAAERAQAALREAQLWDEVKDRLRHPATALSGGQQQRLCLARSLALEPEILLVDEPTASLDFHASAKIEELLVRLKEKYSIIAVSHSLIQARRLADRIVLLREGAVVSILERDEFEQEGSLESLVAEIF